MGCSEVGNRNQNTTVEIVLKISVACKVGVGNYELRYVYR